MTTASSAREACPSCGADPRSALVCEGCGSFLEPRTPPTPYESLGLALEYALDPAATQSRMLSLSRALHPDFHSTEGEAARRRAENSTALLNSAFQVLSRDTRRADWLVQHLGGPNEIEERSMPDEFLQEVLEWNEAIEEARSSAPGSSQRLALAELEKRLDEERAHGLANIAALLTPLPPRRSPALRAVRRQLNSLRYLERALAELGELRVGSRP